MSPATPPFIVAMANALNSAIEMYDRLREVEVENAKLHAENITTKGELTVAKKCIAELEEKVRLDGGGHGR